MNHPIACPRRPLLPLLLSLSRAGVLLQGFKGLEGAGRRGQRVLRHWFGPGAVVGEGRAGLRAAGNQLIARMHGQADEVLVVGVPAVAAEQARRRAAVEAPQRQGAVHRGGHQAVPAHKTRK